MSLDDRHRHSSLIAALAIVVLVAPASAAAVRGIRSLVDRPVAPLGSVLMLPLGAERPGDRWPATLDLEFDTGESITGTVVWIHAAPPPRRERRTWTGDPRGLAVRAIEPIDDSAPPTTGAPFLLARLPRYAEGALMLGSQQLLPVWSSPNRPSGGSPLPSADQPRLPRVNAADRPDPDSPFEFWRWVLLADRLGFRPPDLEGFTPAEALLAEHFAAMWRIGLGKVAEHRAGIASACRDDLTRICLDGDQPFAAWVADPRATDELLAILHRPQPIETVSREALVWSDARSDVMLWSEVEFGPSARIAIVNRGTDSRLVRVAWFESVEPPIVEEVQPGTLSRITIDRPRPRADDERAAQVLDVRIDGEPVRMSLGPRVIEARPPATIFPTFRAALVLVEVEAKRQRVVAPERATQLQVRRRAGRWEAFVECRRPDASRPDGESVVLSIGTGEHSVVTLRVPERGAFDLVAGHADPTLEVHRASYADRWYARIVLPDAWLRPDVSVEPAFRGHAEDARLLRVGAVRTHGDSEARETTPSTGVPWRQEPARAALDLSAWTDAP